MPYLVDTINRPDPQLREALRPAHLAYLDGQLGLLIAAGAKLSDDGNTAIGSFYILDVEDRAGAEAFMSVEPYSQGGLLSDVRYTRWRRGYFDHRRHLSAAGGTQR